MLIGCTFGGLLPDSVEVVNARGEEVFACTDGMDIIDREGTIAGFALLEDVIVKASHQQEADELGEVGLSVGEIVDAIEGGGFVFEEEFGVGAGEELLGGFAAQEGDGDGDEAGIEGLEVVGIHFLEGMESGEGEGEFIACLRHAPQGAEEFWAEFACIDQFFDFLKFIEGNDQSFASEVFGDLF